MCSASRPSWTAADVEERLVERQRLDERRERAEDRHDLARHLDVAVESAAARGRPRGRGGGAATSAWRSARRTCAPRTRRPRRRRALRRAADDHRLAPQRRVVALLDGRVEGVEVGVDDGAWHRRQDTARGESTEIVRLRRLHGVWHRQLLEMAARRLTVPSLRCSSPSMMTKASPRTIAR